MGINEAENNNCDSTAFFHEGQLEGSTTPPSTPPKQKGVLSMKSPLNDKSPVSPLMSSPCDDRVPSRIPLSVSGKGKN